jgi:Na+:H+ antiporter, NhaA family
MGVPVATDIAFALGILTLAASRAPVSLRSFLLTLAIVDDIGAILLIAIFYSGGLAPGWLAVAAVIVGLLILARLARVTSLVPYLLLGVALWIALYESGVHPTLAGSRPRADYTGRPPSSLNLDWIGSSSDPPRS